MAITVNRSELAEHFGVSLPTVDRWIKEGMPVQSRGAKGVGWVFALPDCIRWFGDKRAESAAGKVATDIEESKRRKVAAESSLVELELAKAMGDVAPVAEFERAQSAVMAVIRQNVMNVPQRAVLQLIGCQDENEFRRVLKAELALALEQSASAAIDFEDSGDETTDE